MALTTVPTKLREKLGDEASQALVELINEATRVQHTETIALVEETFERRLVESLSQLETRLDKRITDEVAKLSIQIAESKADLMKWMVISIVGQTFVILGVLAAFLSIAR